MTEANFSLFTNKLLDDGNINPAWGHLKFTISPEGTAFANLDHYDELFVQGMTFFMPGARMTNENNVQANLIPTGAMRHRIKKREMGDLCGPDQTPCCQGDDPHNLCTFENFTFSAGSATQDKAEGSNAPTEPQTVNYMSWYRNTDDDGATTHCDEYDRHIVFSEKHGYNDPPFEDCTDDTAFEKCQNYCTSLDFKTLDNSNPAQYSGRGSKYNFASLFAGFELSVKSQAQGGRAGVHLEGVSEIWLGLWLGPAGEKNSNLPSNECLFR